MTERKQRKRIGKRMTIDEFMRELFFPARDMEPNTRVLYEIKARRFSRWLGRPATLADLTEPTVNAYLEHRLKEVRRATAKGDRAHLVALWNAAYDLRILDDVPRRVKRIKRGETIVEGWTPEKLGRLLKQCDAPPFGAGRFRGKPIFRPLYWRAVVMFAYDTGLRLGDVLRVRFDELRHPEPFTLVQHKTGKAIRRAMRPETWEAVKALRLQSVGPRLFDVMDRRHFFTSFKKLTEAAGVGGTFKYLRRTSGSMVEAIQPGAGGKHLGHCDPTIFDRHYNVRELTDRPPTLPPSIVTETIAPTGTAWKGTATMKATGGTLANFAARGFKAIKRGRTTMFVWRRGEPTARAVDGKGAWRKNPDETGPAWRTVELAAEQRDRFERIAAECYCGAPGVSRCDFCSGAREA